MADPAFGTTVAMDISLGDIETALHTNTLVDHDSDSDPWPRLENDIVTFDLGDVVIVRGQPADGGLRGAKISSKSGASSVRQITDPVDPQLIQLGTDAIRWRPNLSDLDPPANGGRRWWPIGSAKTTGPVQSLYSVVPVGRGGITNGRGTYGPDSPYIDPAYTYSGYSGPVKRPAMVYKGQSVTSLNSGSGSYASTTFAAVVVFHPSDLPYYGLFEAQNGSSSTPLVYRYAHGRLDVFYADQRVISHETVKPAHYPAIIIVSMDSAANLGRFMVIDQSRTSREFNISGVDFISMNGIVGALGQGTDASPWRYASQLDLLELDIWPRALSFAEMEAAANLLSLAYGVAG